MTTSACAERTLYREDPPGQRPEPGSKDGDALYSRETPTRTKNAIVERRGLCRRARPRPAFLSGPCRAVERRRYRAGPLRRAAQHDEERPDTGQSGRFTQLAPVIRRSFDIASMARLSVGPSWSSLNEAQRQQVTESFGRYISAIYADRFDSYAGQKLEVTGEQPAPSGVMVKSQIIKANGEPVKVDYLMRRNGESWLISDIYLDGAISEVATRRSEFAAHPEERRHRRSDRRAQPQGRYPHRDHGKILLVNRTERAPTVIPSRGNLCRRDDARTGPLGYREKQLTG